MVGSTLTTTNGTFTGGEGAITVSTVFQLSNNGTNGWTWLATGSKAFLLTADQEGKYIRSSSTGTDSIGQTAVANAAPVGPVEPQTTIGAISYLVNGTEAADDSCNALAGSSINVDCVNSGGTATNETYFWKIRSGSATIVGSASNKTCDVQLGSEFPGMVQVQCTVSSVNSSDTPQSGVLNVVLTESMKVADPEAY